MREWLDEAIVVRLGHFRESDVWLRMLLKNGGMQTVFAFGAARSRRRFCGCLDVFNTINASYKISGRSKYINLEEATLVTAPVGLRGNWRAMGIAANCLLFLEACGATSESSAELFKITEDLRCLLENGTLPPLLPLLFRLRVAGALGQGPDLTLCGACGGHLDDGSRFIVEDGRMLCPACASKSSHGGAGRSIGLGSTGVAFLQRVQNSMPTGWPVEPLTTFDRQTCSMVVDAFIQYHLGLVWENCYFRRM